MLSYLALGDSYTIGEQVPAEKNFPHQLVELLRADFRIDLAPPEIIAKTGWTTDELAAGIAAAPPRPPYDLVTLLIGVNNQYRGRDTENYKLEFGKLVAKAIYYAGGNARKVFVLSIPDWGLSPFAEGRDRPDIAADIDAYNKTNQAISLAYGCRYLDITPHSRTLEAEHFTPDGLHYTAGVYGVWAKKLAGRVAAAFGRGGGMPLVGR